MTYDEPRISNKIKGAIAEQLFELIHIELRCQVLKTGHEHLYPNLLAVAQRMKIKRKTDTEKDKKKA